MNASGYFYSLKSIFLSFWEISWSVGKFRSLCTVQFFVCTVLRKKLSDTYGKKFPKSIEILGNNLKESLPYYVCPMIDAKKTASTNMLERLNREIRRRTGVVGIFPNPSSYIRLVSTYLMEYEEDWSTGRC